MSRLEEIAARVAAATSRPWLVLPSPGFQAGRVVSGHLLQRTVVDTRYTNGIADAAFIAAARDDVPWLLAEVERLTALKDVLLRCYRAEWELRFHEDEPRMTPTHNVRVDEWHAAQNASRALLAVPPERTP